MSQPAPQVLATPINKVQGTSLSATVQALLSAPRQLLSLWPAITAALTLASLAVLGMLAISAVASVPVSVLTRDPNAVAEIPAYVGLLSITGGMAWFAVACICLFAAAAAFTAKPRQDVAILLAGAGLITAMLALDDMLMIHETVFPAITGLSESVLLAFYGLCVGWFLLLFHRHILNTDYILLLIAMLFFGASLVIDVLYPLEDIATFAEDSLKFAGIIFWSLYFVRLAFRALMSLPARLPEADAQAGHTTQIRS